MRYLIKLIIPESIRKAIKGFLKKPYKMSYRRSYSQSGEDMILDVILYGIDKGFYVDIGANNPRDQSNTCYFYQRGWSGINIDALPGSMKPFNTERKRDINLEIPISDTEETLTYYNYETTFYNTFDKEQAKAITEKLVEAVELNTKTLAWVLDNHCPVEEIDFLTVDTEGFDLKVLKSNNWEKYRPKVVVVEMNSAREYFETTEIAQLMKTHNYTFSCNTTQNAFFIENEFLDKRNRMHGNISI